MAAGVSLATALASVPLQPHLDLANIAMLSLLTVVLVAVRLGRGPAALASLVGVASFDFIFVPPRFSFAVGDFQYVITFGVMLAVGLITGHLTAGLRFQARVASHREARARALYEFSRPSCPACCRRSRFRHHEKRHRTGFPRTCHLAAAR